MPLALWSVLVGGFAAALSILTLLLAGAAVAGLIGLWATLGCAALMIVVVAALVMSVRYLPAVDRWIERHGGVPGAKTLKRGLDQVSKVAHFRTSVPGGVEVLLVSLANLGARHDLSGRCIRSPRVRGSMACGPVCICNRTGGGQPRTAAWWNRICRGWHDGSFRTRRVPDGKRIRCDTRVPPGHMLGCRCRRERRTPRFEQSPSAPGPPSRRGAGDAPQTRQGVGPHRSAWFPTGLLGTF